MRSDAEARTETPMRRARQLLRLYLAAIFVCLAADIALAGFLPAPFEFSFFTPGLTELFLLPFRLAGCG